MRVLLAAMPWHAVNHPSLAISLLVSVLRRDRPEIYVVEYQGGIRWAEFLLANGYGESAVPDYTHIADNGVTDGLGDWVFVGSLYDDPGWRVAELRAHADKQDLDISKVARMRTFTEGFVEEAIAEILAADPDVVGFTSTFMQNVPSLALARRLKRRRPSIRVVFGANCDGLWARLCSAITGSWISSYAVRVSRYFPCSWIGSRAASRPPRCREFAGGTVSVRWPIRSRRP